MKANKFKRNNIILLIIIALLIIPQTRKPIQIVLYKGLAMFGPSIESDKDREVITFESWKLRSLEGQTKDFKDAEGKVVFLNFWATWCPPCIAEMPSLQLLYNDYKDKIEFVLISDEDPEAIKKFLNEKGYDFTIYNAVQAYPEAFNIRSIPRTFLIGKNGQVVIDKKGAANWNSDKVRAQIDALLLE